MNYTELIQQMAETILTKVKQSLEEVKCDKTITATVDAVLSPTKVRILYNGMTYTAQTGIGCSANDKVRVCAPSNNWNDLFVTTNITKGGSNIFEGTFTASGWTGSASPYSQTVKIAGIVGTKNYERYSALTGSESASTVETYNENLSYIFAGESADGKMTLYATQKPTINMKIRFKEL